MGWGNCGTDSKGRSIGYCHEAVCDHPGCDKEIDRGLAYACGSMHGTEILGGEYTGSSCEKYFCYAHLEMYWDESEDIYLGTFCEECGPVIVEDYKDVDA